MCILGWFKFALVKIRLSMFGDQQVTNFVRFRKKKFPINESARAFEINVRFEIKKAQFPKKKWKKYFSLTFYELRFSLHLRSFQRIISI